LNSVYVVGSINLELDSIRSSVARNLGLFSSSFFGSTSKVNKHSENLTTPSFALLSIVPHSNTQRNTTVTNFISFVRVAETWRKGRATKHRLNQAAHPSDNRI
jgi:ABC-type uncharacterized transport system permease subunit